MNMRWRWIEISPKHMPISDLAKIYIGRLEETEAHVGEALRLSPRDTLAYAWMHFAGMREESLRRLRASGPVVSTGDRGQPKLSRIAYFQLAAALAQLGRLDEALSAVKAGLALNPDFTISRAPRQLDINERRPEAI